MSSTCNIHIIWISFRPTHWHYFRPLWKFFFIWAADISSSSSSSSRLQSWLWQHVVWGRAREAVCGLTFFLMDKSTVFCVSICLCVCFQILPLALGLDGPDLLQASASNFTHLQLIQLPHLHSWEDSLSHPSPVPYWPFRVGNGALKAVFWDFCLLSSRGHLQSCVSDPCCLQAFVPALRLP